MYSDSCTSFEKSFLTAESNAQRLQHIDELETTISIDSTGSHHAENIEWLANKREEALSNLIKPLQEKDLEYIVKASFRLDGLPTIRETYVYGILT